MPIKMHAVLQSNSTRDRTATFLLLPTTHCSTTSYTVRPNRNVLSDVDISVITSAHVYKHEINYVSTK